MRASITQSVRGAPSSPGRRSWPRISTVMALPAGGGVPVGCTVGASVGGASVGVQHSAVGCSVGEGGAVVRGSAAPTGAGVAIGEAAAPTVLVGKGAVGAAVTI